MISPRIGFGTFYYHVQSGSPLGISVTPTVTDHVHVEHNGRDFTVVTSPEIPELSRLASILIKEPQNVGYLDSFKNQLIKFWNGKLDLTGPSRHDLLKNLHSGLALPDFIIDFNKTFAVLLKDKKNERCLQIVPQADKVAIKVNLDRL